jgi:hypothetical protein
MNLKKVEEIAEAVLYEGYMLYPYRPSSAKNRQRWNFGVLCPRSYCEQQGGSEAWMMQTECLVSAGAETRLQIGVRFLQLVKRSIGRLEHPLEDAPPGERPLSELPDFEAIDRLEVNDRIYQPWDEAMDRELLSARVHPAQLASHAAMLFAFPRGGRFEYIRDENRRAIGVVLHAWEFLAGSVEFAAQQLTDEIVRTTVRIRNLMPFDSRFGTSRDAALPVSLISTHTILGVEQGKFVSLLEPPDSLKEFGDQCDNVGTWPVLIGDPEKRETNLMLSSPIILYDYPQVAQQSPGALFDGTEIDEILSLRILALTEDEKREMRSSDDRARSILERTEHLSEEQFARLHGTLRGIHPLNEGVSHE